MIKKLSIFYLTAVIIVLIFTSMLISIKNVKSEEENNYERA